MPITIGSKTHHVPGFYGIIEVVNLGNTALPAFNNLIMVGSSKKGIPFNITGKKGYEVIKTFASINEAKEFYGVCDLTKAAEFAKEGGAGVIHFVNVASLTPFSAVLKDNQSASKTVCGIAPADKFYGASGNDISITIATTSNKTTITIIPPKLTKFLSANASTSSKVISLDDVEGLFIGQSVKLVDNTHALQSTSIVSINSANNKVELADLPSSAFATSGYARIFQEDTGHQETKAFDGTSTADDVVSWINSGKVLKAERGNNEGVVPTTLAKTYVMSLPGATKGTSPAATETSGGSFDAFANSAMQLFEEFTNFTKVRLRLLNLLSSDSSVHAVYNALAKSLRNKQYSIQVISGVALGDIDKAKSNADHPINRAKSINSGDFILAGMGKDNKAAYLSSAPFVGGIMSSSSVKRNLTNDVVSALKVEKFFGESNKETETEQYLKSGVLLIGTGKNGYYLIQGVNTYQNHSKIWNEEDDTSYLIQQRQIVDYFFESYKEQMEQGVGADGYDTTIARTQGLGVIKTFIDDGFLTDGKMLKVWKEQNAIYTKPQIKPIDATDFVGGIVQVLIEN